MHFKAYLIIILSVSLNACTQKDYKYSCELSLKGEKIFKLDSVTYPFSYSLQYLETDSSNIYLHFNERNSQLSFYDYDSGIFLKKIEFDARTIGCCFVNSDSIFLFSSYPNEILLYNLQGERENEWETGWKSRSGIPEISSNTVRQTYLYKGKIFFSSPVLFEGSNYSQKDIPQGGVFDLNTGSRTPFIYHPFIYFEANWGHTHLKMSFHTFNLDQKKMILSFPASSYLYIYDMDNYCVDSVYCPSKNIQKIKPYSKNRDASYIATKSVRYYASTPTFHGIFYDKYRKVYYRFGQLANSKRDFNKYDINQSLDKEMIVMILDENFNVIGETIIGFDHWYEGILITPDGLVIRKKSNNEDIVHYSIYNLIRDIS